MSIDAVDRKIIEATQAGLPLAPVRPDSIASLGVDAILAALSAELPVPDFA